MAGATCDSSTHDQSTQLPEMPAGRRMNERYPLSANTGFLWRDLPFLDRIDRAAAAGFDAVEFHDEAQHAEPAALAGTLERCGLPLLSLNTRMGMTLGSAALPGDRARREIDEAAALASRLGARAIHVLPGLTEAPEARAIFEANLRHALAATDRMVLIEPISPAAIPGYFLNDLDTAAAIIDSIGHPRLRILFDTFHVAATEGDVGRAFARHARRIGHVQIASYPGRAEPDEDTLALLPAMRAAGYAGVFGCEYRARGPVEAGLGWRDALTTAA
jgi:hydroxypyruvate isomerase